VEFDNSSAILRQRVLITYGLARESLLSNPITTSTCRLSDTDRQGVRGWWIPLGSYGSRPNTILVPDHPSANHSRELPSKDDSILQDVTWLQVKVMLDEAMYALGWYYSPSVTHNGLLRFECCTNPETLSAP
jgi:hypothetical protein